MLQARERERGKRSCNRGCRRARGARTEVEPVPRVPEVGVLVHHEAAREDLEHHLRAPQDCHRGSANGGTAGGAARTGCALSRGIAAKTGGACGAPRRPREGAGAFYGRHLCGEDGGKDLFGAVQDCLGCGPCGTVPAIEGLLIKILSDAVVARGAPTYRIVEDQNSTVKGDEEEYDFIENRPLHEFDDLFSETSGK
jgi:hypothetical protein